ncbi:MAG: alpha/beta hydrolase, partial [Alphaproteobacteria bacterium]|nr:alpha/beta hydrolase [Alphaproteobacteria bacterium]
MPHTTAPDGIKLYYEEAGSGTPILFVHEYCGDWRAWEPQMRFFARRHRCITYSFRGYPESDVPESGAQYGQQFAVDDARHMLDHLGIAKAHIVGLSQGAFATAHFGRLYRERALSLTVAGIGSGADRAQHEQFKKDAQATAERIRKEG